MNKMTLLTTTLSGLTIYLVLAGFVCCTNTEERDGKFLLYEFFNIVRLNKMARVTFGLQMAYPISVFMPDLGIWGRHSRAMIKGIDGPWKGPQQSVISQCPSTGLATAEYLQLMKIHDEACQELFVCEMSSDPSKFMPVSEIVLKTLAFNKKWMKNPHLPAMINTTDYKLFQAAQVGADANQDCINRYWYCPVDATSMINMDLLTGWQILSRLLDIRFVAATQENLAAVW